MKRLVRLVRQYSLFSLAVLALAVALILQLTHHQTVAHWLIGIVAIIELLPLIWESWQTIRAGTLGLDLLSITAIVTALVLHEYWTALVIIIVLHISHLLEALAGARIQNDVAALRSRAPEQITVLRKGKTQSVLAANVHAGERIIVEAGEILPVDAEVIDGKATIDTSPVTGNGEPALCQSGDTVLGGSLVIDGVLTVKALASPHESHYLRAARLLQSATKSRSAFMRLAERYSMPFTFTALAIGSAIWIVSGHAVRFLEVIVVATPFPLLVGAPLAIAGGLVRANRAGIIFKSSSALDRLANAEVLVFSQTGTLTTGELQFDTIQTFGKHTKDEVLRLTASLEQASAHAVAAPVIAEAQRRKLKLIKAKHARETAHLGLQAVLQSHEVAVGRLSYLQQLGVKLPAMPTDAGANQVAVYVSIDGELAGIIMLRDEIKSEAVSTFRALRRLGAPKTLLLTGVDAAAAAATAKELKISEVQADTTPADSLRLLEDSKDRPLVYISQAATDGTVLHAADAGMALGQHNVLKASESASILVVSSDLRKVAAAYRLARRTLGLARLSVLAGMSTSLLLILIAATGILSPLAGALLQIVVIAVTILSAARAQRIKLADD